MSHSVSHLVFAYCDSEQIRVLRDCSDMVYMATTLQVDLLCMLIGKTNSLFLVTLSDLKYKEICFHSMSCHVDLFKCHTVDLLT